MILASTTILARISEITWSFWKHKGNSAIFPGVVWWTSAFGFSIFDFTNSTIQASWVTIGFAARYVESRYIISAIANEKRYRMVSARYAYIITTRLKLTQVYVLDNKKLFAYFNLSDFGFLLAALADRKKAEIRNR